MKKLVSAFLAIILVFSFGVVVHAEEMKDNVNSNDIFGAGATKSKEEYLSKLTEYDLQKIAEKIEEAEQISNGPVPRASYITVSGFSIYQQPNNYYCVPACVKSVLQYINGTSPSQATIASALGTNSSTGTDITDVPQYLNSKQNFYFTCTTGPSQTTMCKYIYATISGYDNPCLMRITGTTTSNWYYQTGGHCISIYGIYSDKSKVQIADPLGGTQGSWPSYFTKSSSVVSNVCSHVIW